MSDAAEPQTASVSNPTRKPEIREQKVRDRRGNVKTIHVKILRGGQPAKPATPA